MSFHLPPDAEKYREQLEARARIYYATSDLWLRVAASEEGGWIADLHRRKGASPELREGQVSEELELMPGHPAGRGDVPEDALEAFADALDELESQPEPVTA